MRGEAGALDLLGDEAPARGAFEREVRIDWLEVGEPLPHRLTRRGGDLAAPYLSCLHVLPPESDLTPVDIQSAYDPHLDLLELRRHDTAWYHAWGGLLHAIFPLRVR